MNKLNLIPKNINYHCLVCDKKITLCDDAIARTINCPSLDAIIFRSRGNWGSKIWDCAPEVHAVICDKCFVEKSHRMLMEDKSGKIIKVKTRLTNWFKWLKTDKEKDPSNHSDSYFDMVSSYFENI